MKIRFLLFLIPLLTSGVVRAQESLLRERPQRVRVDTVKTDIPIVAGRAIGGISVDSNGRIYSANFGKRVYRVDANGSVTLLTNKFVRASGNTIDDHGELLQSEYERNELYRVHEDGSRTLVTDTGLQGPVGVVMHQGEIFVLNYLGDTISRIARDGVTSLFSTDPLLNGPNGIAFDDAGDLYVVNLKDNLVLRIDGEGCAQAVAALGQRRAFNNAHLVAMGGRLYVSKIFEHRIYRLTPDGDVDLLIGSGAPGVQDGFAPGQARLYHPNGMAKGPDGRIYTNNYIGPMGSPTAPMRIRTLEPW